MIEIIMASYNGEKYIQEQVQSIIDNSCNDWHLTIRDDGSTDKTVELLQMFQEQHPDKVTLYYNRKNMGAARNFLEGIKGSNEDYVMLCDQDDIWKENKIKDTLNKMKQMERKYGKEMPIAVFSDAELVDRNRKVIHSSFFQSGRLDPKKTDISHLLMENKLLGCTIMVNDALKQYLDQLPTHPRMHDWWIGLIAASFGKIGYLDKSLLEYRQHGKNVIGSRRFIPYLVSRSASLRKQKKALKRTTEQAKEFEELYGEMLSEKKREILHAFSSLYETTWGKRRLTVIKYHFFKTGISRNIGIMVLL